MSAISPRSYLSLPELLFDTFSAIETSENGTVQGVRNTLLNDFTPSDLMRIVFDERLRSISCSTDLQALELTFLRAQAMREKFKQPVILVVHNRIKAEELLAFLEQKLPLATVANLFYPKKSSRKVLHRTIFADPDFILCSYHKLFRLLSTKALPSFSHLIFHSPLSRDNFHTECILLDQILLLLPPKKAFTFIHGEELRLKKEELTYLFGGESLSFRSSNVFRYDLLKNFRLNLSEDDRSLSDAVHQEASLTKSAGNSYLLKLIFALTFRRRRNLKQFRAAIQETLTYRLWFSPKLTAGVTYSFSWRQLWLLLYYLTERCSLRLLEKKADGYYYMTEKGKQFFHRFSYCDGLSFSLFNIIRALSNRINSGKITCKALNELLNDFTGLSLVWDIFYLEDNELSFVERQKVINKTFAFRGAQELFEGLAEVFDELTEEAKRALALQKKALQELSAKAQVTDENSMGQRSEVVVVEGESYLPVEDKATTNIYSKGFLQKQIQKIITRENLTTRELSDRLGASCTDTKVILEKLTRQKVCVKVQKQGVFQAEALYGTAQNLASQAYLSNECHSCVAYYPKVRLCILQHLLAEYSYSSLKQKDLVRAFNPIPKNTCACEMFHDAQESKDFTLELSAFGYYTRVMKNVLESNSAEEGGFDHRCLFCNEKILAFGSREEPFFPSRTITCGNCGSKYQLSDAGQKVWCVSDNQNVIRSIIYRQTASVPKVLQQSKERVPITINDEDQVELILLEEETERSNADKTSRAILRLNSHDFSLPEIERVYFRGIAHQDLEEQLKTLDFPRVYRRKQQERQIAQQDSEENTRDQETTTLTPNKKSKYSQTIALLREKGSLINSFLQSKILSVICFILSFSDLSIQGKKVLSSPFNKELGNSIKILMRAKDGISDPNAARLLEAQAFKQAFKVLKAVARKAGILSWGRVVSRLVSWLIFTIFTRTCAYSPLDAMLNHLFKIVSEELKTVHQKIGLAVDFGPGLIHYRKSKSDIDRIGLFLDLIDFVRLAVIFVLAEAIHKGEIVRNDCRLFLGRGGIPLYDINPSSLEKFEKLAPKVLTMKIIHNGEEKALKEAYEDYLQSFLTFIDHLSSKLELLKSANVSEERKNRVIKRAIEQARFIPLSYQPTEYSHLTKVIHVCSDEWKFLYRGFEERYLLRRKARERFRQKNKNNLFRPEEKVVKVKNKSSERRLRVSLTKYQKRSRRWVAYFLLVFINCVVGEGKTIITRKEFQVLLGLKYTKTRLLLEKMVQQQLLIRHCTGQTYCYLLNWSNETVRAFFKIAGLDGESNAEINNAEINDRCYSGTSSPEKLQRLKERISCYIQDYLADSPILGLPKRSPILTALLKKMAARINSTRI